MSEGYKIQPESTGGNVRVTSLWVNSVNVLQQGVSIADPTSGWQAGIDSAGAFFGMSSLSAQGSSLHALTNSLYGSGVGEAANISSLYALTNSMYVAVSSVYSRLAHIESWSFISGAGLVAEGLLDNQGNYVVPVGVITMTYSAGILATKSWTDGTYTWTITYGNDGTNITSISKPART